MYFKGTVNHVFQDNRAMIGFSFADWAGDVMITSWLSLHGEWSTSKLEN